MVRRLAVYLSAPGAQTTAFDTAVAQGALHGKVADADVVGGELLAGFEHLSTARKRLLFDVYLAVTGAGRFEPSMLRPVPTAGRAEDNTVA
ncbi:hypothetical protein [Streptomyces sp. NPDC102437]|uniref:hypothetical protein n=1 Tax=Streptomyces sp. NPDC102437 TaxID=3366175 RepID=UPI0038295C5E